MPDVGKWYKFNFNGFETMGKMVEITGEQFSVHAKYPEEKMLSLPRPYNLTEMTRKEINLVNEEEIEVTEDVDALVEVEVMADGTVIHPGGSSVVAAGGGEVPVGFQRPPPQSSAQLDPYEGADPLKFPQSTAGDEPSGFNPDTVAKVALVGLFVAICFSFN